MVANKKLQTPRCGICKRLYSSRDDDGSGLCPKCRPANSQPVLVITIPPKTQKARGDQSMKEFDEAENQNMETTNQEDTTNKVTAECHDDAQNGKTHSENGNNATELIVTDLITPGKRGVTNFQMIPAIQRAVEANSVEQLILLRQHYPQIFENSLRYLKKRQREYVAGNLK
jgi:hypothetical protein